MSYNFNEWSMRKVAKYEERCLASINGPQGSPEE